jgi:predicted nuclease of predicted toxin-antitoxin system
LRFLADEGVERQIVRRLRSVGWTVDYVAEQSKQAGDITVLAMANRDAAILITNDKDFGDLIFRQNLVSTGVLLLRLEGVMADEKSGLVEAALTDHHGELSGHFCVLTRNSLRVRPLGPT